MSAKVMRIRCLGIIVAVLLSVILCNAQRQVLSPHVEEYKSADGALVAVVRSSKTVDATDESRVELRTKTGKLLAKRDYSSEDGEHGYAVTKAAWTPDSQFFVYSIESSGGHQAWHSPVEVYSRRENRFFSLDHALNDAVMNPQFSISAPDRVTVELWFSKQTKTVSLSRLRRR